MREVLVEGPSRRGRPLGRWENRVKEYMCERGASTWEEEGGHTISLGNIRMELSVG